jgi:hypothetical protein
MRRDYLWLIIFGVPLILAFIAYGFNHPDSWLFENTSSTAWTISGIGIILYYIVWIIFVYFARQRELNARERMTRRPHVSVNRDRPDNPPTQPLPVPPVVSERS